MEKEIISLKDGVLISSIDGEIEFPNLNAYWVHELTHNWDSVGLNSKDIKSEPRYSYISLAFDLIDYYGLKDSCWSQNLAPSMNFDYPVYTEEGDVENQTCWISFPNSNITDTEEEELNFFGMTFDADGYGDLTLYFDTIEEVLGFIKSNWGKGFIV